MVICGISDLHGNLIDIPKCDIVCCCGDIVPLDYQTNTIQGIAWFELEFLPWVDSIDCKHFIFIGGNHDWWLFDMHQVPYNYDGDGTWKRFIPTPSRIMKMLLPGMNKSKHNKLIYLCDNSVEIEGLRIYGTPWIRDLDRWAFFLPNNQLQEKYALIPKKCDILMTHMPTCLADIGTVLQLNCFNSGTNYGSPELQEEIDKREIKWVLSGHVHSQCHLPTKIGNTMYAGVSILNEDYKVTYEPLLFEI